MDFPELKQGQGTIAEGVTVGPVKTSDETCPLTINGETANLTEMQCRHLAAYLVARLRDYKGGSNSICGRILAKEEDHNPDVIKYCWMEHGYATGDHATGE